MIQPNFSIGPAADSIKMARQKFVGHILQRRAFLTPNKPALEWNRKVWSYQELNQEVNLFIGNKQSSSIHRSWRGPTPLAKR